jgi:hypothetical protein
VTSCLLWRHRWMTFYAKPTNRPLALEGWFEKPKNRLFGHVRVNKYTKAFTARSISYFFFLVHFFFYLVLPVCFHHKPLHQINCKRDQKVNYWLSTFGRHILRPRICIQWLNISLSQWKIPPLWTLSKVHLLWRHKS